MVDFLYTRRRCDIYLRYVTADDVDPDKDQSLFTEDRTDGIANFSFAAGQFGLLGLRTDVHIRSRLTWRRHAQDAADRFAVDKDDPFIAFADSRHVLLDDNGLAVEFREELQQ